MGHISESQKGEEKMTETISLLGLEELLEEIAVNDDAIKQLKERIKQLEKVKAPLEKVLKEKLENADQGVANGFVVSYPRSFTHRFDSKALEKDDPETFARYYKEVPSRRFTLKRCMKDTNELVTEDFNF